MWGRGCAHHSGCCTSFAAACHSQVRHTCCIYPTSLVHCVHLLHPDMTRHMHTSMNILKQQIAKIVLHGRSLLSLHVQVFKICRLGVQTSGTTNLVVTAETTVCSTRQSAACQRAHCSWTWLPHLAPQVACWPCSGVCKMGLGRTPLPGECSPCQCLCQHISTCRQAIACGLWLVKFCTGIQIAICCATVSQASGAQLKVYAGMRMVQ